MVAARFSTPALYSGGKVGSNARIPAVFIGLVAFLGRSIQTPGLYLQIG